ncbi:MAG: MFS transporter [Chloroflexota bacterium]
MWQRGRDFWRGIGAAEAALYLMAFLLQLGMGIMAPVLPEVQDTFGVSTTAVSLTISAYGFARLVLDLPAGVFVERLPASVLFVAGTFAIALGAAIGAAAAQFELIIVGRAVMGAGSAICMMSSQYTLSRLANPASRGRVLGYYQAASLAGSSFSPAVGGAIAVVAGWRASFAFCAVTALLALLSVLLSQRQQRPQPTATAAAKRTAPAAEATLARRALLNFWLVNGVTFVLFFHTGAFTNTVVPLLGSIRLGLDAGAIGLAIGAGTLVRFFAALAGGALSDRYGRRRVLVPGLAILGTGVLLFAWAQGLPFYVLAITVMALGRFGNSLPTTIIIDQTPSRLWGRAISVNRFTGDFGAVVGPLALGWIVDNAGLDAAVFAMGALVWTIAFISFFWLTERPRVAASSTS